MQTASKKVINGWAMYDWANSVYNLVITSTIFPAYYVAVTSDNNENTTDTVTIFGKTFINTSLYNYALAIAFIIVAILSPLLSSIADFKGNKKQFLFFFCTMGSLACSGLYFFDNSNLVYGLACVIVACVGFWGSLVFYNSYLPEIAAPEDQDRVSAKGFMMGYLGSIILQIICFILVLIPEKFGITTSKASQISFLLVGIWWWGFAQLALIRLPKGNPSASKQKNNLILGGYKELNKVWQQIKKLPVLKRFLLGFFFYNMGVQTVMLAATLYGKSELQIPTTNLIVSILLIQFVAIPGAYLISKLSDKVGNFKALMFCVVFWMLLCVGGFLLPVGGTYQFYILALLVGFVMGGIQSLSRSTYSKILPQTKDTTSFFSFYDVTEKIAIVIGMFSYARINDITGSQRNSVLALILFFAIGLLILILANQKNNLKEIKHT
jgi:UMF1 family MFS transporter